MAYKCNDRFLVSFAEEKLESTSFYSSIRSAVILLKLHGLFPFENVRSYDGRSLSFKWFSFSVLWGFVLYASSSMALYWLAFEDRMKNLVFYQYVVRIWLFYICYSINNRKFLNVLGELEEINDKLRNTSGILERNGGNLADSWRYCVAFEICAFTLHCFTEAMFILSEMRQRPSNTVFTFSVLLASVTSSVETYVSILYLLTASRINSFYTRLYNRLRVCLSNRRGVGITKELDLSDVCDRLNEWFGLSFLCIFSVLVVRTLLIFYKITISTGKVSVINDVGSLAQIFGYLYVLTSMSHKMANTLRLMILQSTTLPVNTFALGFFNTTRSLIPAILAVIAVYVTVIIQLGTPLDIFYKLVDHSGSHVEHHETE